MKPTLLLLLSLTPLGLIRSEARADPLEYIPQTCDPRNPNSLYCGLREPTGTLTAACPNDRWIGFFLTAGAPPACPAATPTADGVWVAAPLFPTRAGIVPPNDLMAFCQYRWQPKANAAPRVAALPNLANFRLQRDCRVVSPLLEPVPQVADIAEWVYDAQANLPVFQGPIAPPPKVRVAIVDNVADETASGMPSGPSTSHGHAMGALARHNSCFRNELGQELGCAAHVVSYQAMPLAPLNGEGGYGSQATVAEAIVRAVQDFKAQNSQSRLIINLSLGWDGGYGGLEGPGIRTGALSVWMAIQWAACEGALIFAAAGNRSSDLAPLGPMFPAAWEMDNRLCQGNAGPYGPPVHAVGAVDAADAPLRISRINAQPRLVAPGSFVSVWSREGATRVASSRLSGTSLAAAGASGVAAMVWSLAPGLWATGVADRIQSNGVSIDGADFSNPDAPQNTRRLDACEAVNGLFAPLILPCPDRGPFQAPYYLSFPGIRDTQWPGLYAGGPTPRSSIVEGVVAAVNPDPYVVPYVTGQPGKPTCPYCGHQAQMLTGEMDLSAYNVDKVIYEMDCPSCPGGFMSVEVRTDFSQPFNVQLPVEASDVEAGVLRVEVKGAGGSITTMSNVRIVY